LVFLVARELFDERVALGAALVSALAPFHINYSQEARMYSLLAAFTLLMVWFFVRAWRGAGWAYWAGFTAMGALSLYTQNLAFLNILAIDLWVLLARRWRLIKPLAVCHLGMAVLFSPWLSLVPSQFGKVRQAYWVPVPGAAELVRTVASFTFNLPVPSWLLPVVIILSISLLVLTLYGVFRFGPPSDELLLVLMLSLGPVVTMFTISQIKSIYIDRGVLPAALAYYILWVAVWSRVELPRWAGAVAVLPFVAVALISLHTHYTYDHFPRSPYPQLVTFLRESYRDGDAIVHDNKLSFFPSYYYDRSLAQSFVPDPPGSGSDTLAPPTQEALGLYATPLETAVQNHPRVWFVIFQRAIEEYLKASKPGHPDKIWMDAHYRQVDRRSFNDLDVYLYER
jgi:mannosyltransferase